MALQTIIPCFGSEGGRGFVSSGAQLFWTSPGLSAVVEIIESTSGGKKLVKIRWPINVESLERQSYDLSLTYLEHRRITCSTFSSPPILQSQKDEGAKLNLFR
ncbi:hypothetical protein TNCV_3646931 [Trichonephila clavipes]|nr:hypothetical protein TNCV_3646931 [Trichonephila clavipes]